MKILIICNNHNCINLVRLCLNLQIFKAGDAFIKCLFASKAMAQDYYAEFGSSNIDYFILLDNRLCPYIQSEDIAAKKSVVASKSLHDRFRLMVPRPILNSTLLYKVRELWISKNLSRSKKVMNSFLALNDIGVVLSISDRSHDYVESATLAAAKSLGIKVILPFTAHYDIDASLNYRKDQNNKFFAEFQPFTGLSIYKLISYFRFKKQLYKGLFFQAPFVLNAHRKEQTLSAYPWWVGNGLCDVVCVDSKHTYERYIENRVPAKKLVVVGHAQYDNIYRSNQNHKQIICDLNQKYGFANNKQLVILSLPQHSEQGYLEWDIHIQQIRQLLSQMVMVDCNFLISLHPRQDRLNYNFILDEYGFNLAGEQLSDIIGAADLFIASNSTTSIWACLCGISGINLSGPIDDLYEHLSSVVYLDNLNLLSDVVTKSLHEPPLDYTNDWKILSKDKVFDGRFNSRFQMLL